jgi:hypothetical protein
MRILQYPHLHRQITRLCSRSKGNRPTMEKTEGSRMRSSQAGKDKSQNPEKVDVELRHVIKLPKR